RGRLLPERAREAVVQLELVGLARLRGEQPILLEQVVADDEPVEQPTLADPGLLTPPVVEVEHLVRERVALRIRVERLEERVRRRGLEEQGGPALPLEQPAERRLADADQAFHDEVARHAAAPGGATPCPVEPRKSRARAG